MFGILGADDGAVVRGQAQPLLHGRVVTLSVAGADVGGVLANQVDSDTQQPLEFAAIVYWEALAE